MVLERGQLIEIVVSVAVVGIFVGVLIWIGLEYNQDGIGADGGLALVLAITAFVIVMGLVGYGLAYYLNRE